MGEKYLGQLTAKSAPATGDVFMLEDSEDTKKIDYDALANAILNKLTTKTYTVAGGTNTLIAAIDALNSNLNFINSGTIFDYIKNNITAGKKHGTFLVTGNVTDKPSASSAFVVNYESSIGTGTVHVNARTLNTTDDWYLGFYNANSTDITWTRQPTRAEMNDAIKATGSNHTFATYFGNDFAILRITQQNGNYTNLTFHDSGKVEIARYADGEWKQGTVLRPADT